MPEPELENPVAPSRSFETPRLVHDPNECWFYHTMDLPEVGTVTSKGAWDLRGRFSQYIGNVDLSGKAFLDVGTGSGFSSFEAQKAGATRVTSFDAKSVWKLQRLPYPNRPPDSDEAIVLDRMKNGYWLAHRLLKSSSHAVYGDVYHLSQHVEPADVVFIGQLLIHLRDPLEALREAALVSRDYLIISEGMIEDQRPTALFWGGNGNYYSWWQFSREFYRQYLDILGFAIASYTENNFHCNHFDQSIPIATIVARRR